MNATPTRPDEAPRLPGLERLIEMLREAQLPVGPSEVIDAAQVLQHLASSVPASEQERSRLKPRLRPALCKSIVDQAVFDDVFERWSALPAEGSGTASIPAAAGAARPSTLRGPAPGVVVTKRSRWHRWAAAATLLAAIAAAAWWYSRPAPIPPAAAPVKASSAPVAPAAPTAVAPDASQTRDPNAITVYGYFPALRANEEIRPFWLWALLLLPLLGIAPALLLALPLPRISRRRGGGSMTLQAWPASKHQRDLVFRIAPAVEGQLQRHVRGAVEHREAYARRPLLDARRTVEATIGRLGVPSPRYRYARLRPAYLVLVQAESVDEYAVLWAQRLRTLDMRVDIFRFGAPIDGAAPRCVEVGGAGRRFGFDALPNPEPGQRLMLLAPTAALLGTDDRLHPWARAARLKRWAQRALFTPDEPRDWNLAHVNALEQPTGADPGMFVLPFDDNALAAWTEWLVRDHLPDIVLSEPQRYPRLLHDGEARFVGAADAAALGETPQAAGKLVSQLVSQLHAYLGDNGFYWLCACAVPPLLKRQLALLLGEQYFLRCQASEERTRYYMARNWRLLVRLPWLRDDAQMPQWLRLALLARLPETIQDELRDVVRGALVPMPRGVAGVTGVAADNGVPLGFEVPGTESAQKDDAAVPATDARHSLYVGFVRDGLTAEQLVLRIPGAWNHWLPALLTRPPWWRRLGAGWARWSLRDGVAGQGFSGRSVVIGAVAVGVGGLGWAALALIQPMDWPAAVRGWVYHEVPRTVVVTHHAAVTEVAYNRDGSRFVTASRDKTARVWDADTGKPVGEAMTHADWVSSVSFSPDGKRVVTASHDNTARVWDADTGQPVGEPMTHGDLVDSASFSPDGRRVVTASYDKTARVWDADTGKPVGEPMTHGAPVISASFNFDGKRVVTASADKTARAWDADTGKPVGEPMTHSDLVGSASFSPDGKRVVTASYDKTARVWDADTGKPVGEPLTHADMVGSASFSPDGKRVVTASSDKTARVWDAGTGKPVGEPMTHGGGVNSASFSPDGKRVVTASWDETARVWDTDTGKPVGEPMTHGGLVFSARFSPTGQRVVTASGDQKVRVWYADTDKPVGEPMAHGGSVMSASFSHDGKRVVTASDDQTARVWDAGTGTPVGEPLTHGSFVNAASFSPDGKRVVTASRDNTARIWDAGTGKPVGEPITHGNWVNSATFSPDGKRVVTASYDKTARVWDAGTGKPIGEPMTHGVVVASAGFSPDGKRVVTASWDKTAHVWDADSGKPVGEPMSHGAPVISASFNFDGKRVVTASADKTARVWDADTGKPVSEPMAHGDQVNSASFSPDGKRVVTAAWDKTARVWEAGSGTPLGPALKHDSVVTRGAFSPDGSRVATVSQDGTARVWNATSGALIGVPLQTAGVATHVDWSLDGQRLVIATSVPFQSSPSGSTGGGWSERNSADVAGSAAAVAQSPSGLRAAQRLKANAAYVVRAPQLPPPPYPGQGGVDRLRELIDTRIETNVGAIAALVGLSAAMALVVAWRQRRQLVSLRPGGTA